MPTGFLNRYRKSQKSAVIRSIGCLGVIVFALTIWNMRTIRFDDQESSWDDFYLIRFLSVQKFYVVEDSKERSETDRQKKELRAVCEKALKADYLSAESKAKTLLFWEDLEPGAFANYVKNHAVEEQEKSTTPLTQADL